MEDMKMRFWDEKKANDLFQKFHFITDSLRNQILNI